MRELLPENDTESVLLDLLTAAAEPQHIDALCRASGLPVAAVSAALVMMELKGLVRLGAVTWTVTSHDVLPGARRGGPNPLPPFPPQREGGT